MGFDLAEKRYIRETGLEARIAAIVEPVANDLGYSLVRIKISQENGMTLQIMAEDANGRFAITDCERLSKDVSPVLDVEDPIDREYHLEVSSPGIDRPLVRARDYAAHIGHEAKIELAEMIDGRKRFRGFIKAIEGDVLVFTLPDAPRDTDPDHRLPLALIAEAKLVMTDALLKKAEAEQEDDDSFEDDLETEEDDDEIADEAAQGYDDDIDDADDEDEEPSREETR